MKSTSELGGRFLSHATHVSKEGKLHKWCYVFILYGIEEHISTWNIFVDFNKFMGKIIIKIS